MLLTYADAAVVEYPHYPPYAGIVERAIETGGNFAGSGRYPWVSDGGYLPKSHVAEGYRDTLSRFATALQHIKSSVLWHDVNSAMKIGSA